MSLRSAVVLAIVMTCGNPGMSTADKSHWIAATLRARSTYAAFSIQSEVLWHTPTKLKVHVRIEEGGKHNDANYAWLADKAAADNAQNALTKWSAKAGATKGPIVLTTGIDSQPASNEPLEIAARDALALASHLHFAQALTIQKWAQELAAKGDAVGAIAACRAGVAALGDRYQSPDLIDDTEMNLITANDADEKGRRSEAQGLLLGVLRGRLDAYRTAHKQLPPPL